MEIREESLSFLEAYSRISIAFEVNRILDLSLRNGGVGGFELLERPVTPTFVKDYDTISGNHPTDWARRFDLSNWGLLSARLDGECAGGAVIALKTPGLFMLEDRSDLAVHRFPSIGQCRNTLGITERLQLGFHLGKLGGGVSQRGQPL